MLRKFFISLVLLCCVLVVVNAASYDIQVAVSTQKTTCYTDGKIFVKLGGADLGLLQASDQISFDVLKDGKSYKQHDFTIADMRADSVFVLEGYPAGAYTLNYSIWIGSNSEISGSVAEFKVEANPYLEPAVFQTLGDNKMMQGTRPSLNCKPTGRIQLEIVQGKFPYTVQIYKNGALFRSDIFNSRMFSGTDPLAEDYRDYYNIEQLGIGSYTFIVNDSCGYQLTLADSILVDDVSFNCVPNFATYTSYKNNQIHFSLVNGFFNNVKYDNFSDQWLEYRFALEGDPLGAWKPFSSSDSALVASLDSVQGKKYKFELREKDCPSYPVCYAEVLIPQSGPPPPPPPCKKNISSSVSLIPVSGTGSSDFCPCNGGTPSPIEYDKWQVNTDFTLCDSYTLPLTYKWTNLDYPLKYSYINDKINSSSFSYLSPEYTLTDSLYNTQIHIELIDSVGRVYLDTIILIPPKPQPPKPIPPVRLNWSVSYGVVGATACSGTPIGSIFFNVNCGNIPDSTVVEMTQTPDNYHFTGTYDLANRRWNFSPSSFSDFKISQSPYNSNSCTSSISIDFDELFRYGIYKFNIKWHNIDGTDTTTTVTLNLPSNIVRYAISENLSFTTKRTCQGTIYYPRAQVLSWILGDEGNKKPVLTKFRVISGNITGYEINGGTASVGLCHSDSLLITKPGRYIVESFCSPSGGNAPDANIAECTVCTDTIDYMTQTLSFDDYYGFLCADSHSSTIRGSVTVIAKDGVPPYRYDLYSGNDAGGKLIGSNNTGVFNNITVTSAQFYVRVEDQCLSSFGVAIPLSPIISTDAVFGDHSVCLGSVAHLQGKMIGTNTQVSYQWTGSDGFLSSNRQIVTPPILRPATYSLEISGLGCRIFDSITVRPVDKIMVYYEDLICQGTDYDGGKEYKKPISTAHLAAGLYHFSSGPFPATNGGCDSTSNIALSIIDENSVIEDTMTICYNQFPFLWKDSLFTEGTPSGVYYMSEQKNDCRYKLALRLTVNHSTNDTQLKIICGGESVVFNNRTYTESGYYTEHFTTKTACDSVVTLHLIVIPTDQTTLIDSIFKGESYDKNGFTFPVQKDIGEKSESLMLKNRFGCDSTVYLQLTVLSPTLVIPEVFSPNGDGINDYFEIQNIDKYPDNSILIFNRWGDKVWQGGPYLNNWDGTNMFGIMVGGNKLPIGTYFYILNLGDGSPVKKDYIYLNR